MSKIDTTCLEDYEYCKEKCADCEGYHNESYDCLSYWREQATLYFRKWEGCTKRVEENEIWIKAHKQMYGVGHQA